MLQKASEAGFSFIMFRFVYVSIFGTVIYVSNWFSFRFGGIDRF